MEAPGGLAGEEAEPSAGDGRLDPPCGGLHHHQIGAPARGDHAAVGQAEDPRRDLGDQPPGALERQEAEIQELRDQVAQLTEAVTLLLKQQTGE